MTKTVNPMIWYGLHFAEGVALYQRSQDESEMVYISDDTARSMNHSFAAKPVYIDHPESKDIDLDKLHEIDGWVVESFYNKADGKHWVKFITVTEQAADAIKNGYKLSNAYFPTSEGGPAGEWHGVPYNRQITDAQYEHLAIVKEPKYSESIILTEEEFDKYNIQKQEELGNRFVNEKTKKGETSMFEIFKREKVKDGIDIKSHSVILPKSKIEMSLERVINMADEEAIKKNQNPDMFCTGEENVKVGEKTMKVNDLIKEYQNLADYKHKNEAAAVDEEVDEELEEGTEENAADAEEGKEADKAKEDKKENSKENFNRLANAETNARGKEAKVLELGCDRSARGKQRYGSNRK